MPALTPLLLVTLLVCQDQPRLGNDVPELQDYLKCAAARDSFLHSVAIPFTVTLKHSPPKSTIDRKYEGTYYRSGQEEAAIVRELRATTSGFVLQRTTHSTWNGFERRDLVTGPRPTETWMEVSSRKGGGALLGHLPIYFGIEESAIPWVSRIKSMYLHLLGTDQLLGNTCTKVMWDFGRMSLADVNIPQVVWVDGSETYLVLKFAHYRRAPASTSKESVTFIRNQAVICTYERSVLKVEKIGGIWLATEGHIKFPDRPQDGENYISVDSANVKVNSPINPSIFAVVPAPDTLIMDERTGNNYYATPEAGKKTQIEIRLESILQSVAVAENIKLARENPMPQPIMDLTCAHGALYSFLRLNQRAATPSEIQSHFSQGHGGLSMEDLRVFCDVHKLRTRTVQFSQKQGICDVQGHFVAHLTSKSNPGETDHGEHFAVVKWLGDKFRIVNHPADLRYLPKEEFFELWSGNALILSEQVPSSGSRLLLWCVSAALVIVCLALMILRFGRMRRLRSNVASLALVTITPFLQSCDNRPPAKASAKEIGTAQASPITVGPALTHEFSEVDEGIPVHAEFRIANNTDGPVDLKALPSCGCFVEVDNVTIAAGSVWTLKALVSTSGRVGGVHESIEIQIGGMRNVTLWITGKIRPGVALTLWPAGIMIDDLGVGQTTETPIAAEILIFKEPAAIAMTSESRQKQTIIECSVRWESDSAASVSTGGHMKKLVRRGVLVIRGLKPGILRNDDLVITCRDSDGKALAVKPFAIRGKVWGAVQVEPQCIFIGNIEPTGAKHAELKVLSASDKAPLIRVSCPWITVSGLQADPTGWKVTLLCSNPTQTGLFEESITVTVGTEVVTLPVVGRVVGRSQPPGN